MQIVKTQTDKLVVGANDVSHPEGKDQSPTGTAVLNGLFMLEKLVHHQIMRQF